MFQTGTRAEKSKSKSLATLNAPRPRKSLLTFVGGMVAAFPLAVAASVPYVNSQVGGAVAQAKQPLQVKTAAANLSCGQPSVAASGPAVGGAGGGQVLGESTVATPPVGGAGNAVTTPVVQRLVGGMGASGSITGPTGPGSTNVVSSNQTETVNLTNNNNLSVSNSNAQSASTGSANVSGNTNGGSADSGDASNQNATALSVIIDN